MPLARPLDLVIPCARALTQAQKVLILSASLALFFGYAGVLALEAVLGLVVYDFYGMDATESWPVWLNLSVSAVVGALFFTWLNKKVTKAWCGVLLYIFSTVGGFLVISWTDLDAHVPYTQMQAGLTLKVLGTFAAVNLHFSLLAERIPPELQGLANTAGNIGGQLGRSVGPVFTMFIFGRYDGHAVAEDIDPSSGVSGSSSTHHAAANAVLITQYVYVLFSIGVMILSWRIIYVGKDALFPPKEKSVDML